MSSISVTRIPITTPASSQGRVKCTPLPHRNLARTFNRSTRLPVLVAVTGRDEGAGTGISRDAEPEEYWKSASEKGGNPFKDPLALIGIGAILFPFLLLGLAVATGVVDTSVYR